MDERLKTEEEKDYLSRADKKDTTTLETFFTVQHRMGTISVITDLAESGERIYNLLKSRAEIPKQTRDILEKLCIPIT
jgi:hypothetical protein